MERSSRARQRDRAVLRTLFGGAGLQVSIALASLASLPFVTRHLSAPEFGVFATLVGFAALLSFTDLGIAGSLATRLGEQLGHDDRAGARVTVSTAVLASYAAGALVFVVLAISVLVVPWHDVLGAGEIADSQVRWAVLAASAATGASVPAAIGQRILYGIGRGAVANAWLAAGAVVATSLLILGSFLEWRLPVLVLAALGAPAVAGICSGFAATTRFAPDLRPRVMLATKSEWHILRSSTGWHFAIAVAGAISFQSDSLIVAGVLGASAAGIYAVCARAFGLIAQSLTPAMLQMWPAFGEAYARGDLHWIRSRLLASTLFAGLISALAGALAVVVGPDVVRAALTDDLVPDRGLLLALAGWTTYSLMSAPTFLLLNATGRVRVHAWAAMGVAVVNIPVSIALTHRIGIAGPALGSLIASVLCSAPVGVISARRLFAEMRRASAN